MMLTSRLYHLRVTENWMNNDTEGQKAIDELNGVEYDSKVISVSVARPREERPSNGSSRGGYNNSRRY